MPSTALQGLLREQFLDNSDLQAMPDLFARDITKELQQAGIQPMAHSGRQSGLSTTAAQAASPPSVLTELIGQDSSITCLWEASQLPQPIMLYTVTRQPDLLGILVPWETLTADFNTALDTNQEHAAAASVPALKDDSQGELWLRVMASHTLSASCTAADDCQGAAGHGHINCSSKTSQEVKAEILSSVACSMEECRAQVETAPSELEVPMLCFRPSEQGVMTEVFQAEQCPKAPEYVPASVADCSVKGSSKLTYHSLVAQELTLQESFYTLPVVLFDDSNDYGLDEAQSKEDMWQQCMAECRFRPLKTGHLDLYMDWSLLPEQHSRLLNIMQGDQRALLREADGIDAEVAKSSILSIQPVEKALNAAAATERQKPGSCKEALKAYAALAVMRQAAQALTQYGIRYAHLYLRHNLEALPMLKKWCVKVAAALEAAYKQVEAGKLEDHPKQAALQKALIGIQTVQPDAKVLLLGDARAFFTMYKAIVDVGLKPFQLDRDERLLKAGLPAEELKKAAGEAATAADCILVTHQQLVSIGFPFERFSCLLEYVQQPLAKAPADIDEAHPVSEHGQTNGAYAMVAEEGVAEPTAAEDCRTERQGIEVPRQGGLGGSISQGIMIIGKADACHPDRPLVVTTNPDCILRQRRSLYEALLQLEQQNAVVIERDLPYVDLVLSPSACLCIWTEEQLLQGTGVTTDSNNSNLGYDAGGC
ncbi:hypothetical protein WJX82_002643 [Trebouxia sp. C0006]